MNIKRELIRRESFQDWCDKYSLGLVVKEIEERHGFCFKVSFDQSVYETGSNYVPETYGTTEEEAIKSLVKLCTGREFVVSTSWTNPVRAPLFAPYTP